MRHDILQAKMDIGKTFYAAATPAYFSAFQMYEEGVVIPGKTSPYSVGRQPIMIVLIILAFCLEGASCFGQHTGFPKGNPEKLARIITPGTKPALLYDGKVRKPGLTFTEGPAWMNGKLYFSNYYMFWKPYLSVKEGGPMVMEPDGKFRILNDSLQTCGMVPMQSGNLAACDLMGKQLIEITPEGGVVRVLANNCDGAPFGMPNDLIIDAKGGIYFTDPHGKKNKLPGAAVYYLNPQGKVIRVTDWDVFEFPNGCVLSPDGESLFLNDSVTFDILAFDVKEDGMLANKRKFAEYGRPKGQENAKRSNGDGLRIDSEGNLYNAATDGIHVIDKTGEYLGVITFPKGPSNCIFGGPDMKTLYATCRDCIYSIRTNVPGLAYPPK
jgi:gluconolactonase